MFRNRGSTPHIHTNNFNNRNNNNDDNFNHYHVPHYSWYWNGNFVIIHYDKTFVLIEMIAWFIILVTVFAVYLFSYQTSFIDPIATTKRNFLTAQLFSIVVSILLAAFVTFFTRSNKEKLIRNLRIVAIISVLVIITFLGIKLSFDTKYTEETFGEFYEQADINKGTSKKVIWGMSGIKIASEKESYIQENINAYTNFSIKAILYMVTHIFVVIVLFYLSHRLSSIERKKERLLKDDAILYDEEENIKF